MSCGVWKMHRMILEIYECCPLEMYAALRSSNRLLKDVLPQFSSSYVALLQICKFLRTLHPRYEHERDHATLPMRFLVLRMLLRWSDPDDGCLWLLGLHAPILDDLLVRTETCGLRSEGVALLKELSLRVSSVCCLLFKRHVEAGRDLRELLHSTSTECSSGWRLNSFNGGYCFRVCLRFRVA